MIVRQVERLSRSTLIDRLIVATSVDASDDRLAVELERRGIEVRRGPLDDVVGRFGRVVDEFRPDTIVRLTADCPLADVDVIDRVIRAHLETGSDYSSNTISPTYPDGLDVECVSASAWARLVRMPLTEIEREHVTLGLYTRPTEFRVNSVTQPIDYSTLRWTVDVPGDLDFVRSVYEHLYGENPSFGQYEILGLLAKKPNLNRTEGDLARNAGSTPMTESEL